MTINPVSAAVAGALISGVAMYTVGARTEKAAAFAQQPPAYVQTVDGRIVPVAPVQQTPQAVGSVGYANGFQPGYANGFQTVGQPVVSQQPVVVERIVERPAPRQTVYRTAQAAPQRVVVRETEPKRSWKKTAMVIGGSSAAGAGVGAIVDGKKGALIGAALGGGAASIYEATKR